MSTLLFFAHFAATWYLVGLCWLVQRVQYPLMARVGAEDFALFEEAHVRRIGPVVAPVMILEAASGAALWRFGGPVCQEPAFVSALLLLVLIWLSTFLVQVPLHGLLGRGFDAVAHGRLVRTNWVRTVGWNVRGLLLLWILGSDAPGLAAG
ncbi:MAG TPA: hypothetical protein VKA74_00900 [Myxococcota bacterium]|nr:hypothetical protein [Myxococcota bacterium]